MRIIRSLDAPPINPFEQHRQLRTSQLHGARSSLWPHELAPLQTLGKQTQAITAPPDDLEAIACAAAKHEELSGIRILWQLGMHQRTKAIKAFAHVGGAGGQPHLHPCRKGDHRDDKAAMSSLNRGRSRVP